MEKRPFILDASILDSKEQVEAFREDVQLNRISFEFPAGFATIPLIEECRALNALDDFDLMYDISMQLLTEKPVLIYMSDQMENKYCIAKFVVTCKEMDLRGVDVINSYPIIVNWMVEFIAEALRKKYPRPLQDELRVMALEVKKLNPEMKTLPEELSRQ